MYLLALLLWSLQFLLRHLHPLLLLEQLQCYLLYCCQLWELLLLLHLLLLRLLLVLDRRGLDFGAGCKCPRSKLAPALLTEGHLFLKAIAPASVALIKPGESSLK